MVAFLFASLGSMFFWMAYIVVMLFVGTYLLKKFSPEVIEFVRTGKKEECDDAPYYIFILIIFYIFWFLILIGIGIYYIFKFIGIIFKVTVWGLIKSAILFADKNTPSVDERKEKENTVDESFK